MSEGAVSSTAAKAMVHAHSRSGRAYGATVGSDGMHTLPEMFAAAGELGISYFMLADHNIFSIDPIRRAADRNAYPVIPGFGAEVTIGPDEKSPKGMDVVVGVMGDITPEQERVIRWFIRTRETLPVEVLLKESARGGLFVMFPHPDAFYLPAITMNRLADLRQQLPDFVFDRVGVEAYNGLRRFFLWERPVENRIAARGKNLGLALLANSDAHSTWDMKGGGYTLVPSGDFDKDFQDRKFVPVAPDTLTMADWFRAAGETAWAHLWYYGVMPKEQRGFASQDYISPL